MLQHVEMFIAPVQLSAAWLTVITVNPVRLGHKQTKKLPRLDLKGSGSTVNREGEKERGKREWGSAISLMAPGCRHRWLAVGTRHGLTAPAATACISDLWLHDECKIGRAHV